MISTKARITRVDPSRVGAVPGLAAVLPDESVVRPGKKGEDSSAASPPAWATQIARYLLRIDEKLDRIIEKLGCQAPEALGPAIVDTVNISGSGIVLVLSEAVEIGQILEISMNLPGFPLGVFEAYGEVVRVEDRKGKDKGLFDVALKFLYIGETDREQLIACSFAAQRKAIRQVCDLD
jgi:hypothetical protein